MPARLLVAAALAVLLPRLALARPAVVRVFEAHARAEPSASAPVLQVFPERAEVSVSEEAQGDWRRVRLADGGAAWIEERALSFPDAAAPPATAAAARATTAPDLRVRTYVKDLDHLAELVRTDSKVHAMADALADRRRTAIRVAIGGGAAALALVLVGAVKPMPEPGDPRFDATLRQKMALTAGGVGIGLLTAGVAFVVHPKHGDLLDVINGWNAAHPDRPFEVERVGAGFGR